MGTWFVNPLRSEEAQTPVTDIRRPGSEYLVAVKLVKDLGKLNRAQLEKTRRLVEREPNQLLLVRHLLLRHRCVTKTLTKNMGRREQPL